MVRADWASFEDSEPILLTWEPPKHQRILFRVEACIEIVSGRGRSKTRRDCKAPLGVERDDHSGIIPPSRERVKIRDAYRATAVFGGPRRLRTVYQLTVTVCRRLGIPFTQPDVSGEVVQGGHPRPRGGPCLRLRQRDGGVVPRGDPRSRGTAPPSRRRTSVRMAATLPQEGGKSRMHGFEMGGSAGQERLRHAVPLLSAPLPVLPIIGAGARDIAVEQRPGQAAVMVDQLAVRAFPVAEDFGAGAWQPLRPNLAHRNDRFAEESRGVQDR